MPNNIKDTTFRKLIDILFEEQKSAWSPEKSKISKESTDAREQLEPYIGWQEIRASEQLPTKNAGQVDFKSGQPFMLLPPLEKDTHLVPWLSITYKHPEGNGVNFQNSCCKIRVLMLGKGEGSELVGMGFRIESPESLCQAEEKENETGNHDFYHAQLIKGYEEHGQSFCAPDWLPCTQPSFPLWATNPVDALLSLILTLYGALFYKEFLKKYGSALGPGMSDEFKKLNERLL
jgi:hypothetical protein